MLCELGGLMLQVLQKKSKVSEKKTYSSTEDESDVEVVCMESQHDKAKSKNKVGTKGKQLHVMVKVILLN